MKRLTMLELAALHTRLNKVSDLLMKGEHPMDHDELQMEFDFLVATLEKTYTVYEAKEAV